MVCIGDNVADYYPEKNMLYPGGSAFNVAVQASRSGMKTGYIGLFGSDIPGQYLKKVLIQEGVDISHIKVKEGFNANSIVRTNKKGESRIIRVNKGVDNGFPLSRNVLKYMEGFDYLHTTTYSSMAEYIPLFNARDVKVSFDYSFNTADTYLEKTAPGVDLAFFSGKGIKKNYRDFMLTVSSLGPEIVIVTLEDKGVLALKGGSYYFSPAPQVETVDTLGAGDAFIASFLSFYSANLSLPDSLEWASRDAARCCTHYGGIGCGEGVDILTGRISENDFKISRIKREDDFHEY